MITSWIEHVVWLRILPLFSTQLCIESINMKQGYWCQGKRILSPPLYVSIEYFRIGLQMKHWKIISWVVSQWVDSEMHQIPHIPHKDKLFERDLVWLDSSVLFPWHYKYVGCVYTVKQLLNRIRDRVVEYLKYCWEFDFKDLSWFHLRFIQITDIKWNI